MPSHAVLDQRCFAPLALGGTGRGQAPRDEAREGNAPVRPAGRGAYSFKHKYVRHVYTHHWCISATCATATGVHQPPKCVQPPRVYLPLVYKRHAYLPLVYTLHWFTTSTCTSRLQYVSALLPPCIDSERFQGLSEGLRVDDSWTSLPSGDRQDSGGETAR